MRVCSRCKVKIENNNIDCPLCGKITAEIDKNYEEDYPTNISKKKYKTPIKIISFIGVVIVIVLFVINRFNPATSLFTILFIGSTVYFTLSTVAIIESRRNLGLMLFINVMLMSLFCVFIDFKTGPRMWSIDYVVPALIILGATIITLIIAIKPMLLRNYLMYQLSTALMGLLSFGIIFTDLPTVKWPITVSAIYSLLIFVGMFLFGDKKTKHEIKKRFHL